MSDPGPIERVVVFDIESECAARGCPDDAEVLLVAQLSNGGLAARWVCRAHEAGAVPDHCPDVRDPATQGCILAQASDRWAEDLRGDALVPALAIERVTGGWRWRLTGWASFNGSELVAVAQNGPTVPSYGEACVSALEGSPIGGPDGLVRGC